MCSTSAMLSNFGKIRFGQKSLLLSCLDSWWLYIQGFSSAKYLMVQLLFTSYHLVQSKLFQNMPTVSLSPSSCNNYSKHLELIVCALQIASRKLYTRDHRGHGTRTKVSGQTKMPKKWNDFFKGFKELICFQGLWGWYSWRIHYIRYVIATVNKLRVVFFFPRKLCICLHWEQSRNLWLNVTMKRLTLGMVLHMMDSLGKGFNSIMIRTVNTDVIVVHWRVSCNSRDLPWSRHLGCFWYWKEFLLLPALYSNLGREKYCSLPAFHAYECDSTHPPSLARQRDQHGQPGTPFQKCTLFITVLTQNHLISNFWSASLSSCMIEPASWSQ